MLSLSALHTHYDQAHILRDVTLEVNPGEVVALLGRNGAGKSTTMKAIIGTVPASSGTIAYRGQDLARLKNFRRVRLGIGYVPEERRIFQKLSVTENLLTGRLQRGGGKGGWTIDGVFDLFPKLAELKNSLGAQLSGGEQQMLTVGRTLMTNPECLLLDEPTEGLAPIIVEQVARAIKRLKEQGLAILLSEQNRHRASELADRVYVLEKGSIVFEGASAGMTEQGQRALGW